ncbi:type III polyketide synthase [Paenibacillus aurantius]|uniref:Type III polyketide synthase n=1 Tax=Paenibacillus aurantius TaxID=2918900 RepID=A0AA96RFW5_9BACL|nr:type III polyketide synthase [Paenibacillus aurantius]WNQ13855.1 type III polyketide synthase [Paenibacillus aurantius]
MDYKRRQDPVILGIGTVVPDGLIIQSEVAGRLAEGLKEYPDSMRWAKRIFRGCGVETRYTCEPELLREASECSYLPYASGQAAPTTRERMEKYKREAVPLAVQAARRALADSGIGPDALTHLMTVSCTGQFLPGLDASLVQELGLSGRVNRIPLQFLGCAAGLKAIGLARQTVAGEQEAKVLVVCVELCTLHIQPSTRREALFGASFFGDGASACVIGAEEESRQGYYRLLDSRSVLFPDSAGDMVWEVGNHGFELYLSPDIPKLLGRHLPDELGRFLEGRRKPELWAIHPGGRGIVDTLEDIFALTEEQTFPSRHILSRYGNMSSATILFVLQEMRRQQVELGKREAEGTALAFGPGLTAELLRFQYV